MHASESKERKLRSKQRLGKYQIQRKLDEGGFATVYAARDTIEGVNVALKIIHSRLVTPDVLDSFRQEVRLSAGLKHDNILPLKNAEFIDGHFVIAYPLGQHSLAARLTSRMAFSSVLEYAEQLIQAVAFAHQQRIIHCDIKPENVILFEDNQLMLTDFGIARVAQRTIQASGSGTVGYVAPEQAMGKPSFRSDVFSTGLVIYRMITGKLPEWPFDWPPVGHERLRRVHPELVTFLRRTIEPMPRDRFRDAQQMLEAFRRIKPKAVRHGQGTAGRRGNIPRRDWRTIQRREFVKHFGKHLETYLECTKCQGPIAESMSFCPWCGATHRVARDSTRFPHQCPRCHRGMKTDWKYCAWCFGPGFEVETSKQFPDRRYVARCTHPGCPRKQLMPFMRYCPWCRKKVTRRWKIEHSKEQCSSCRWPVVGSFWSHCPWCGKAIQNGTRKRRV